MRIEYQGVIEVRPSYQHVGYTAAAINPSVMSRDMAVMGPMIGLTLILVLMTSRVMNGPKTLGRSLGVIGLLVLTAISAAGAVWGAFRWQPTSAFVTTVQRMERLGAQTEGWAQQHGRLPTAAEWPALHDPRDLKDAWGVPFTYQALAHSSATDGQRYVITAPERRGKGKGIWGELPSTVFGVDGLFGTADDRRHSGFHDGGAFGYRKVDFSDFPHARQARAVAKLPLPREYALTLQRLERLNAATKAWARQHVFRRPDEAEWEKVGVAADKVDGWGRPLQYRAYGDRRGFEIACEAVKADGAARGPREGLSSRWLGPDGLAATADDEAPLKWLGEVMDLSAFEHGVSPHPAGTPTPSSPAAR